MSDTLETLRGKIQGAEDLLDRLASELEARTALGL
jgi:hypothetical protein